MRFLRKRRAAWRSQLLTGLIPLGTEPALCWIARRVNEPVFPCLDVVSAAFDPPRPDQRSTLDSHEIPLSGQRTAQDCSRRRPGESLYRGGAPGGNSGGAGRIVRSLDLSLEDFQQPAHT